jgi:hypothetical protein
MTSSYRPVQGFIVFDFCLSQIQKALLNATQRTCCVPALLLTGIAAFVSFGFQTQAAELLGYGVVTFRNWALLPQLLFSLLVVNRLPIKNFSRWLAITGIGLMVTLGLNLNGANLFLFILATILGSFQVSLTWKLCARSFPNPMQGQGAQNLACLAAMAIAGGIALSLKSNLLYASVSIVTAGFAMALTPGFQAVLDMQRALAKPKTDAMAMTETVSAQRKPWTVWRFQTNMDYPKSALLWTLGVGMLYPVSMSVKIQADTYILQIAKHYGAPYVSIEAIVASVACAIFTVFPGIYAALSRRVGGEGRLMATSGVLAAVAFIISGFCIGTPNASAQHLGIVVCVYALRGFAGICFEIFERGSEYVSDQLTHGRKNEFAASLLVTILYRPFQLLAGVPMLVGLSPSECFMTSGTMLLVGTCLLIWRGAFIGRAFLNYAGPRS